MSAYAQQTQHLRRKVCAACQLPFTALDSAPINAFRRLYHAACFRCVECRSPSSAAPLAPADAHLAPNTSPAVLLCGEHRRLHESRKLCMGCGNPVAGRALEALGGFWHDQHLVCSHCRRPVLRGHVEHLGRVYCPEDFSQLFSQAMCKGCRKVVRAEDAQLAALDARWHRRCFVCGICRSAFPDKVFYVVDGRPYCKPDYYIAANAMCKTCVEPIQGQCCEAQEGRFHPPCFTCAKCMVPLTNVYYNLHDVFYCEVDVKEVQDAGKAERRRTLLKDASTNCDTSM